MARNGCRCYFELAFGPVPGERDEHSMREDVVIDGRFRLRGAIDLIEEHMQTGVLRITDHKTGRRPDRIDKVLIGGGAVLQPVLYSMAVETALDRVVHHGRLFYCTSTGSFSSHPILLDERIACCRPRGARGRRPRHRNRLPRRGAYGRGVRSLRLQAGVRSDVFRRVARKPPESLADLAALRSRP